MDPIIILLLLTKRKKSKKFRVIGITNIAIVIFNNLFNMKWRKKKFLRFNFQTVTAAVWLGPTDLIWTDNSKLLQECQI